MAKVTVFYLMAVVDKKGSATAVEAGMIFY
jgi:hypothetical protein